MNIRCPLRARLMAPREYENDDIILRQGDVPIESPMAGIVVEPIDGMFILIEGAAQALKTYWFDHDGKVVYDYRVGKDRMGDYFGEGTFLGAADRATTIKAVGHTRVIHIDSKVFARLRAGKVDKMLNEHYLKQLESEHKLLADMKRVEECSELYQAIEDFALDNDLPMPKLTTTEQLGGFRQAGATVKAVVKMKRRARRASVELMERQKAEEMALESVDEDEDEKMLREMRDSEGAGEEDPTAMAQRDKVAKSLAQNKARGRRASVDLTTEDMFNLEKQKEQSPEKKGRYQGRRRSVSEWDAAGGDAVDPLASPATTPVRSPKEDGDKKLHRSRSNTHSSSSSSKHKEKDSSLRRTQSHASHSSRHKEKDSGGDGDGELKRSRSSSKHKSSSGSGESGGSPKPRRRRASVQND